MATVGACCIRHVTNLPTRPQWGGTPQSMFNTCVGTWTGNKSNKYKCLYGSNTNLPSLICTAHKHGCTIGHCSQARRGARHGTIHKERACTPRLHALPMLFSTPTSGARGISGMFSSGTMPSGDGQSLLCARGLPTMCDSPGHGRLNPSQGMRNTLCV